MKIRLRNSAEDQKIVADFAKRFYELAGVEYPPRNRSQWLSVLLRGGFTQEDARLAYREFCAGTAESCLDPEDFSTTAKPGENPTFTQTLMDGLERAAKLDATFFTEESRPSGEWCIIFGLERDPPTPITRAMFGKRRKGTSGKLIRCITSKPQRYKIHIDDLPSGTKSLNQRNDIIRKTPG